MSHPEHAPVFRRLHEPGAFLILPNAWDAGSARVIEDCGAPAIATSSAGLAWAHGYADGHALPPRILAGAIAEIARAIRIPLTADIEGGYSDEVAAVAEVVANVVEAGAVGINIEDGSTPPDLLCAKIEAAKRAAARAGVELFVNARTDVFLRRLAPAGDAVATTVERAARYRDAGADGIFVPYLLAPADIRAIAAAIAPLPLNAMATAKLPPAEELRALGVRRLSAGAAIASRALSRTQALATAFLRDGRSATLFEEPVDHPALNALFNRP